MVECDDLLSRLFVVLFEMESTNKVRNQIEININNYID